MQVPKILGIFPIIITMVVVCILSTLVGNTLDSIINSSGVAMVPSEKSIISEAIRIVPILSVTAGMGYLFYTVLKPESHPQTYPIRMRHSDPSETSSSPPQEPAQQALTTMPITEHETSDNPEIIRVAVSRWKALEFRSPKVKP